MFQLEQSQDSVVYQSPHKKVFFQSKCYTSTLKVPSLNGSNFSKQSLIEKSEFPSSQQSLSVPLGKLTLQSYKSTSATSIIDLSNNLRGRYKFHDRITSSSLVIKSLIVPNLRKHFLYKFGNNTDRGCSIHQESSQKFTQLFSPNSNLVRILNISATLCSPLQVLQPIDFFQSLVKSCCQCNHTFL